MLRLAAAFIIVASLALGCDCNWPNVRDAKRRANIVFRGRITGFRDTGKGYQMAVFSVDRVWKGNVTATFEMPALEEGAACLGFWPNLLKVGKNLLVYAYRFPKETDYITDICTRTSDVERSKDFADLGPGRAPKSK